MQIVFREFPEARGVVVGDKALAAPNYLREIEELSQTSELKGRIFFPGHCRNVPSLLDAVSVFVLPSRNDPMPLAVLEAMAAGKAIVATDVGCLKEMINPPAAGSVVPPENPEALAREILALLRDGEIRRKLGAAARDRARQKYSMKAFQRRIDQIVREALEGVME